MRPSSAETKPELDGFRGLAVLLVLIHHVPLVGSASVLARTFDQVRGFFWCGVDLFFVLSGYLITGILLRTRERGDYFRRFYLRRALRIFPAFYLCLAVFFYLAPWLWPATFHSYLAVREDQAWYWAFLANFKIAHDGHWPHGGFTPLWSLAVEEQFYLVWPLVVLRFRGRRLLLVCGLGIAFTAGLRLARLLGGVLPIAIYTLSLTRLDGLLLGAVLAVAARDERVAAIVRRLARPLGIFAAMSVTAVAMLWGPFWKTRPMIAVGYLGVATAAAALLYGALGAQSGLVPRFFRLPVLRALGKYSYALYLYHYFVVDVIVRTGFPGAALASRHGWVAAQVTCATTMLAATCACAFVSWWAVERWFLRLKDRLTSSDAKVRLASAQPLL